MSSKQVTQEQIKRIEEAMKHAPRVEGPLTVGEAVRRLSGSIKNMRGRGYSWQQIADVLRTEGIVISGETLRRYVMPKTTAKRTASGSSGA